MQTILIGPLAFSADRLLAITFISLFILLSWLLQRRQPASVQIPASGAILAGLIIARLIHVILNADSYQQEPWSILAIWQGGFHLPAGLAGSIGYILLKSRASRTGVLLGAASLLLWSLCLMAQHALQPRERPLPPGLSVTSLTGTRLELDNLSQEAFVINLWASWCGPCRRELKRIDEVGSQSRLAVIMINQGEDVETVRRFLVREGLSTDRIFLDPASSLSSTLGSSALPVTLFIAPGGIIRKVHTGEISRAELVRQIRALEHKADGGAPLPASAGRSPPD
jgi:thiol-disulfide isomerase/thioredoxin